jgi:NDP-sugar pyrophosphorylase family protein
VDRQVSEGHLEGPRLTRAVVLAGGLGMRLRPYTAVLPKPLMPIGDRPVLDIVVRQLHHHEFERVTIATGYLAELIEAFFRDGNAYGIPIDYHREHTPLGTAGAIGSLGELDSDFMVMNGDVLTDLDYRGLMEHHQSTGAVATIATITRDIQISLGVLRFTDPHQTDRLTAYDEKPSMQYEASMGVYAFSPKVLEYIEPGQHLDFPDLIRRLLDAGELVRGYRSDCYWMDIGRHEDYETAVDEFERLRSRLIPGEGYYGDRRRGDDRRRVEERREAARRTGEERRDREEAEKAAAAADEDSSVVPLKRRAAGI